MWKKTIIAIEICISFAIQENRENIRYEKHKCRRGPHQWTSMPTGGFHLNRKRLILLRNLLITLCEQVKSEDCTGMIPL